MIGEEGDLFVVDRSKDLVIVSGFNVYPAEVEKVVSAIPGVAEAVVVGRPDPETGEAVEVVIVLAPGATVTEERGPGLVRETAGPLQVPDHRPLRGRAPPRSGRQGPPAGAAGGDDLTGSGRSGGLATDLVLRARASVRSRSNG